MNFPRNRKSAKASYMCKDSISTESSSCNSSPPKDNLKRYLDFDGRLIKTIPEKHKTELCKTYSELGSCRYGDKCRFAHGTHELVTLRNENGHYRQRKCKGFWDHMCCKYGVRCQFGHTEPMNWEDKLILVVGECIVNPEGDKGQSKLLAMLQE